MAKTVGIIFGGALSLWVGLSVGCVLFAFRYLHCICLCVFALLFSVIEYMIFFTLLSHLQVSLQVCKLFVHKIARWLFVLRDDHFSQVCFWSDLRGLSFLSKQ